MDKNLWEIHADVHTLRTQAKALRFLASDNSSLSGVSEFSGALDRAAQVLEEHADLIVENWL